MSGFVRKYWSGTVPKTCDVCNEALTQRDGTGQFVDGRTRQGPWGHLCMTCWPMYGAGPKLGVGVGQQYTRQQDGRWLKTAG